MSHESLSRSQVRSAEPLDTLRRSTTIFEPFRVNRVGETLRTRGGTPTASRAPRETPAEHSFLSEDGLLLCKEAALRLVESLEREQTLAVDGRDYHLPTLQTYLEANLLAPEGHPMDVGGTMRTGMYAKFLMECLEYPEMIPALDAMWQVAGVEGLNAVGDRTHKLFDVLEECVVEDCLTDNTEELIQWMKWQKRDSVLPEPIQLYLGEHPPTGIHYHINALLRSTSLEDQELARQTIAILIQQSAARSYAPDQLRTHHVRTTDMTDYIVYCLGRGTVIRGLRAAERIVVKGIEQNDPRVLGEGIAIVRSLGYPARTDIMGFMATLHSKVIEATERGDSVETMRRDIVLPILEEMRTCTSVHSDTRVLNRAADLVLS